jgi:hypothetical protein
MQDNPTEGPRSQPDRRWRPTSPLDAFRSTGRRTWPRREEEREGRFFVERFGAITLAMVVGLLALTIADGVITIELLDINSVEANPFMNHLLSRGQLDFLLGKYILTAAGLPFLIVYQQHSLFGTRFRVGFLLPMFIGMYLVLISYQWVLLNAGRSGSPPILGSDFAITATLRSSGPLERPIQEPFMRARP